MTSYKPGATVEPEVVNIAKTAEAYAAAYPGIDPDGVQVALLLSRASARQSAALDKVLDAMGVGRTRGRYGVLRVSLLAESWRLPQYAIMGQMNVTSASMTGLIDGLVNDGLVMRHRDASDKTSQLGGTHGRGAKLCERLMPAMISDVKSR